MFTIGQYIVLSYPFLTLNLKMRAAGFRVVSAGCSPLHPALMSSLDWRKCYQCYSLFVINWYESRKCVYIWNVNNQFYHFISLRG